MSQTLFRFFLTSKKALVAAVAILGLMSTMDDASAKAGDRSQPLTISADNSHSLLTADGTVELVGNVRIDQGTLAIRARHGVITLRANQVVRVVLDGEPATLEQEADDGARTRAAARNIDYDIAAEQVVLTKNVTVTISQPQAELHGERITYDLKTEKLDAGGDGGGIHMVIAPQSATSPASAGNRSSEGQGQTPPRPDGGSPR